MAWEVENIEAAARELRGRGVLFEERRESSVGAVCS
jgi:hypothetical protein